MTTEFPKEWLGTVSHGTHRNRDLIPAMLDCLKAVHPEAYEQMWPNGFSVIPFYALDDMSDEWWESEDADYVSGMLSDTLCECAPEGYYFGAHPGDGSDFGFWEHEE